MIDAPGSKNQFPKLRQAVTPEQQDAKLKQVGDLYEKQFLREMVKAMRATVHESGFIKSSQAEKIFKEQLDQEYVEKWGAKGGIGLSDLIHQQLLDKYGAQLGIKPAVQKPVGPIHLDEKSNFNARVVKPPASTDLQKLTFEYFRDEQGSSEPAEITSPWAGKILGQYRLDNDENLMTLDHDNGLKSSISYRGLSRGFAPGQKIEAGEKLGLLSPEAQRFFWSLQK
jgi:flagellar protein FlgJ